MNELSHTYRFESGGPTARYALLALHGTGGDEHDLVGLARRVSPDAPIISPRGNVDEQGMNRFFRRIREGVFDLEDLALRTRELAVFIDAARDRHQVAHLPLVAIGFSNGANIAGSLLLSDTGKLAGAMLLRPMVPFEPRTSPALKGIDVLCCFGRDDTYTPPERATRLVQLFRDGGASVQSEVVNSGHALTMADVELATAWAAHVDRTWNKNT